ncbi:Rho termination factor N-terminal domain-containing protein [Caldicoprobacter faecalis]|uniref:Rho termination factor, N-terminal domain n=1 Tax=Caldicoprobacter faecalis TaxID=937334 RepID=A0A1I5WT64_9FIRM|nr:Rho termination factor N-terminal domain-containing protein [Caldicoprobacter faecalis]SFQ22910.1 Rho termination factor, N-terminal domain [Caldicoprobacter faecalis]
MWIRNKRTGMIWEIIDEKMIKRLLASDDYEEVQEQQQDQQEQKQEKIDLKKLSFNELKHLASEKGINTYQMTKKDLLKALKRIGV